MTGMISVLIWIAVISVFVRNIDGFSASPSSSTVRLGGRFCARNIDKLPQYSSTTLSSSSIDIAQTTMFISAQLEAYEKQGVPEIVLPLIVSLIVGTILLPLTARKFQKDRNTRSLKNSKIQQEPEDAAGAYEKFYKINAPEDKL